jgi:hypothetical protein
MVGVSLSGGLGGVGPVRIHPDGVNAHIDGSIASVGPIGPVTVGLLPTTFDININKLPKIQIGVDPVTLHLDPVEFGIRITEMPSIRGHLPADFSVGLSLLGFELLCVRLCGEAQIITEPYRPNPCERCGATRLANPFGQSEPVSTLSVHESSGGE